jgi:deoxyribonuclease V
VPGGTDELWPGDVGALLALQQRLGAREPPPWDPGTSSLGVAAAAVVHGSGPAAERAWAGAVLVLGSRTVAAEVVADLVRGPYVPGLRSAREGPLLVAALAALRHRPDVLMLAAAGRDHPRRAGLALHAGAALRLPSIGVTDRPLTAQGPLPGPRRGDTSPLVLDGVEVARWVRTAPGVRPIVAHAAWRTTADVAASLVLSTTTDVRTPLPLREARRLAREARART